jgi:hypothetical protein
MGTAKRRTGVEGAVGLGVSHSPEHAIREWLSDFRATWRPAGTEPSRMRAETVRFVKQREAPGGPALVYHVRRGRGLQGHRALGLDRGGLPRR